MASVRRWRVLLRSGENVSTVWEQWSAVAEKWGWKWVEVLLLVLIVKAICISRSRPLSSFKEKQSSRGGDRAGCRNGTGVSNG